MSGLVSIIIPTYNREKFLPYALESIRNQTYKKWELIIVDDGSTDNTEKICKEFAKTLEQPVKYIYQNNQGVAGARNTGLKNAIGDFIAFLDSDDTWYSWHLKKCIEVLSLRPNMDFIFAGSRKVDFFTKKILVKHNFFEKGKPHPIFYLPAEKVKNAAYFLSNIQFKKEILSFGIPSNLRSMVFRRKSIENVSFPDDLKVAEDQYFVYRLVLEGKKMGYLFTVNAVKFVHDKHLSGEILDDWKKAEIVARNLISCYNSLLCFANNQEKIIIKKKIANFYINYLSVSLERQGKKKETLYAILNGIKENPFKLSYYKSLISSILY